MYDRSTMWSSQEMDVPWIPFFAQLQCSCVRLAIDSYPWASRCLNRDCVHHVLASSCVIPPPPGHPRGRLGWPCHPWTPSAWWQCQQRQWWQGLQIWDWIRRGVDVCESIHAREIQGNECLAFNHSWLRTCSVCSWLGDAASDSLDFLHFCPMAADCSAKCSG